MMLLRSPEKREEREAELRERNQERWDQEYLKLEDCARLMNISRSTARRIYRHEPGVDLILAPGSHRPIIRVPRSVFERVMRRSEIPWK